MFSGLRIVAIIPARSGSERLRNKNIYPVCGHPMLTWGIRACNNSNFIDRVYVSSDSEEYLSIARRYGSFCIKRPAHLADDKTCKQDVIAHAANVIPPYLNGKRPDIIISLQPNSPEVSPESLDLAITKLFTFNRNEIFTVDNNLIQNAAFRVMRYEYVFQKSISTKCGCMITDFVDVHTLEDVKKVEKRGLLHDTRTEKS